MKNKYAKFAKISEVKIRQIIRLFCIDLDASQIAQVAGLNRNTVNRYLLAIRTRIAQFCEATSPFHGEVEVDESYFGARRIKGMRGRGARGKTIVFGVYSSVMGKFIVRSCLMYPELLCKRYNQGKSGVGNSYSL